MNHPVAIVFIHPWNSLLLAVAAVLLPVALQNLWRSTRAAALMADLEQQCADLAEQAGMHAEAAEFRGRARQWRRLAWPRRVPPAVSAESPPGGHPVTERHLTCQCGHSGHDHDAGECWAEVAGQQCPCDWWEPIDKPSEVAS